MNSSDPRPPDGRAPPSRGWHVASIHSQPIIVSDLLFLHFTEETLDSVLHQAADGHRTYSTRNRSDY